jgi:hypothetical protein
VRKWKWLFVNIREWRRPVSSAKKILNSAKVEQVLEWARRLW